MVEIGDDSVLVVAFDGLDYELIQRYNCTAFTEMAEFGTIDNDTGICQRKTSELFASFITGTTYEDHGVTGISTWTNDTIETAESLIQRLPFSEKTKGLRTALWENIVRFDAEKRMYRREDVACPTIFDRILDSKALFVPSYTTSWLHVIRAPLTPLQYGATLQETEQYYEREFQYRKKVLFEHLDQNARPLLMCHLHKPDVWQHLYASDGITHESKIRTLYREMNDLAETIRTRASGYDTVLFLSDHGLPTATEHNTNAFYSLNRDCGLETPHITDFYDRIFQWADADDDLELANDRIRAYGEQVEGIQ